MNIIDKAKDIAQHYTLSFQIREPMPIERMSYDCAHAVIDMVEALKESCQCHRIPIGMDKKCIACACLEKWVFK